MDKPRSEAPATLQRRRFAQAALSVAALLPGMAVAAEHHHRHALLSAPHVTGRARPPRPLVMLDPGHGGKDPGAIGVSGTYEKHIAIAAATELRRQLLATGRYRVSLSRNADIFIPLEDRVAIAQGRQAALFVSMHADALHDPSVRGASVYTLSETASDAQTASLARTENSADRFGGPHVHSTSPEVQRILASLVRQETRMGSARMARGVVGAFRPRVTLLNNPDRHAAFVVLKAADIPSVLVEMGFMSNGWTRRRCARPAIAPWWRARWRRRSTAISRKPASRGSRRTDRRRGGGQGRYGT